MSTILITGGTGAIGSAIAAEFAATDDVVFTYNTRAEQAQTLCERLHCAAVQMDAADRESVERAVAQVLRDYGHIDVLVNNAGISQIKLFGDITPQDWDRMLAVNLTGCFNTCHAVLRHMIARKSGAIVNVSSVWGVHGASCEVHYSAAKAGVIGLTKALAKEVGASGVTVNCVAPGVINTDMVQVLGQETLDELVKETPLGRLGTPEDIAYAVAFFASERAGFITGQVLTADGGFIV